MASSLRLLVAIPVALLTLQAIHLTPATAAEKWVPVGQQGGAEFSVDANSVKKKGNIVWFWMHIRSLQTSQGAQQMLLYASADCRSKTARVRKVVLYDAQGRVINSAEPGDAGPLTSVLPNDDPVIRYVCAR